MYRNVQNRFGKNAPPGPLVVPCQLILQVDDLKKKSVLCCCCQRMFLFSHSKYLLSKTIAPNCD